MIKFDDFHTIADNRRGARCPRSYIWISGKQCTLTFDDELRSHVKKYFGDTVNVKANSDFSQFIIFRGADKRIKDGKSINMQSARPILQSKYGDNVHYLYYDGRWEETDTGIKVYLLEISEKQYHDDCTIRTVKRS